MMKDKKIAQLIAFEKSRQKAAVNLIASENYVSRDVCEALGSVLTNKYAEGYPDARYYGGNEIIDDVERLCRDRALKLFKLSPKKWHVNVQALSGSPANLAVYTALVPKGGKIMGMTLSCGGHLTHGHKVSVTGKFWKQVPYCVDEKTEKIDYEKLKSIARKEQPDIIVAGFTAYPRKINFKKFHEIADAGKSILMVDMSHIAGLVAGGVHPSPFKYADIVTTTTHKTLRGPRHALIFCKQNFAQKIDKAVFPGLQGGPHMNTIAAVAVALKEARRSKFKNYIKQVVANAQTVAKELKKKGWRIVSGGTDTHLLLIDTYMSGKGILGADAEKILEKAGIVVNKNAIPGDTRKPSNPSGIRIGTAAETTRGAKARDMITIAAKIDRVLKGALRK